jgi:hypothetical protein
VVGISCLAALASELPDERFHRVARASSEARELGGLKEAVRMDGDELADHATAAWVIESVGKLIVSVSQYAEHVQILFVMRSRAVCQNRLDFVQDPLAEPLKGDLLQGAESSPI